MTEPTDLSKSLEGIPIPGGVAALPVDPVRKIPVPWFVPWVDGKPEFRAADSAKLKLALAERLCWVCGGKLGEPGGRVAFVIGPMCSVNKVSAEPPCHEECAVFSAKACPFLAKPHMKRRESDFTSEEVAQQTAHAPGVMLRRNPGCCAVWVTRVYQAFRAPRGDGGVGILFDICSRPDEVLWFAEGRTATRAEVEESIRTGVPALEAVCRDDAERAELGRQVEAAAVFLPAA